MCIRDRLNTAQSQESDIRGAIYSPVTETGKMRNQFVYEITFSYKTISLTIFEAKQ